jgi:hypothetical protein
MRSGLKPLLQCARPAIRKSFAATAVGGVGRHLAAFPGRRACRLIEPDSGRRRAPLQKSICSGVFAASDTPHRADDATRAFVAML